jgi:hypothetical protein
MPAIHFLAREKSVPETISEEGDPPMPYSHEGSSAEGEVGPKTILVREDDEGIGELITETESAPLKLLHVLLLLVVKQDDVLSPSHCIVPLDLPLVLEKLRALR